MARETIYLTEFWKKVLQESEIIENRLFLKTQMDRKQYVELNKVLELLWWKWNRWQKCHIFDCNNLKEAIEEVCDTMEVVDIKIMYQQYYTPSELAKRVVELADINNNDIVLEPSAWQWAIVQHIPECKELHLVEIDKWNFEILKKYDRAFISNWDFLEHPKYHFTKIVMNPPFTKSQDVKHILKAYSLLSEWWRIVSIASASIKTRQWKIYDELRELNPEFMAIEDWAFKDSWTMVNSILVVINK